MGTVGADAKDNEGLPDLGTEAREESVRNMLNIPPLQANLNPTAFAYWDVVGCWFKEPNNNREVAWLSTECGAPILRPPFRVDRPARFDHRYRQYLRLLQPSKEAIGWLARRDDVRITYLEPAVDYGLGDDANKELADAFNVGLVQRWHRKRETTVFANGNGRTGKRSLGGTFQYYADAPSKVTGEIDVFHLEARVLGAGAIRSWLGIERGSDLLAFDHGAFWKRVWERKLTLVGKDLERLGRWIDNKANGTKRRHSIISRCGTFQYNEDQARGRFLHRYYGRAGEAIRSRA